MWGHDGWNVEGTLPGRRHWPLPGDKVDTASGPVLSDSRGDVPGDLASEGAQLWGMTGTVSDVCWPGAHISTSTQYSSNVSLSPLTRGDLRPPGPGLSPVLPRARSSHQGQWVSGGHSRGQTTSAAHTGLVRSWRRRLTDRGCSADHWELLGPGPGDIVASPRWEIHR